MSKAPCANQCEAKAFAIEIRQLRGRISESDKRNLEMLEQLNDAINENQILKAENDNWRKHGTSLNDIRANAIEEIIARCSVFGTIEIGDMKYTADKIRAGK